MAISEILTIIVLTGAAGSCIPIGGLIASIEHMHTRWLERELRHFVIALGGGIILGATAVALVPEGIKSMNNSMFSIPIILFGGVVFYFIERFLGLRRREAPQVIGMILDYLPEAIALGGLVAIGSPMAPLLAVLIGLQNLPEGFNSYRELIHHNHSPKKTLLIMTSLILIGPVSGLIGFAFLVDHQSILGAIMLFSAGGVLYLIFQDIAPQSRLVNHWAPPLGAVLGFCIALFSKMMIVHG